MHHILKLSIKKIKIYHLVLVLVNLMIFHSYMMIINKENNNIIYKNNKINYKNTKIIYKNNKKYNKYMINNKIIIYFLIRYLNN